MNDREKLIALESYIEGVLSRNGSFGMIDRKDYENFKKTLDK